MMVHMMGHLIIYSLRPDKRKERNQKMIKNMNNTAVKAAALAMSAVMTLSPVTAFAQDINAETEIAAVEEVAEETVEEEEVKELTAEVTDTEEVEETEAEEVVDETVLDEEVVEEAAEETAVAAAVETEEETTVLFDKKAVTYLNDAAAAQAELKNNSFKTGYAATNQVDRCRRLATKLLVFKLKYIDGEKVIGTAYDMAHGDNNYISVNTIDQTTGESVIKYYDFYMQDSNGNNIDNMFKYYTVDRITIVEKGEKTGEKKIGMYVYPTFASKSNGNVVLDINSYSELLSEEYRAFVAGSAE